MNDTPARDGSRPWDTIRMDRRDLLRRGAIIGGIGLASSAFGSTVGRADAAGAAAFPAQAAPGSVASALADYAVTWTTASRDVGGAMPIGNGVIAAMVWAEPGGDLRLRLALNDAWDENARSIGLSNFRIRLSPNPFASGQPFRQELRYESGTVVITAGSSPAVTLRIWVDANQPVVHIESSSTAAHSMVVSAERWRTTTTTPTSTPWMDFIHAAEFNNTPGAEIRLTADTVVNDEPGKIVFFHRNETSVWAATASNQSVPADQTTDPYLHRTTGAVVQGTNLAGTAPETLSSTAPGTSFRVDIAATTMVEPDINTWKTTVLGTANTVFGTDIATLRGAHEGHWNDFWTRSHLFVTGDEQAAQVTRGWIAARYLMALQGRAEGAIEFNGGAFTLRNDTKQWHDYTQFNQRFPYWSMLGSGDADLMAAYFDVAVGAIPVAKLKTRAMWNHDGLILPEHMIFGGFQSGSHHGWNRDGRAPSYIADPFTRLLYHSTPEIAVMMLDHYDWFRDDRFVTDTLLPFAKEVVVWYDQHWPRSADGRIRMGPAYSGEADRNVTNAAADVAALQRILRGLLALPTGLTAAADRSYWTSIQGQLPPLPISDGRLRTAESLALGVETNNQNLFSIFPFRLYGNGLPDRQIAIDSYLNRVGKNPTSGRQAWRHDADHAAYLGLTDEARTQTVLALTRYKYRWEGFVDGTPDGDHSIEPLAIGKTALQAMLLHSTTEGSATLFNAWPSNWDATFKLWAPQRTSVEGTYTGGTVTALTVTPAARVGAVTVGPMTPGVTLDTTQYVITTEGLGLAVDVAGAQTGDDVPIQQNAYTAGTSQRWTFVATGGGFVRIMNENSGRALVVRGASTAAGAPLIQYAYAGGTNTNDEWRLDDVGNGCYQVVNRLSGLAMATPGGASGGALTQQPRNGSDAQRFRLGRPIAPATYRLTVRSTGLVPEVERNSSADGARIIAGSGGTAANQQWRIAPTSGGFFTITAVSSGKALVVLGAATGPAPIVAFAYSPGATTNDEWRFDLVRTGDVEIVNRRSGLLLTVPGGQGTQLTQARRSGAGNQRFRLEVAT